MYVLCGGKRDQGNEFCTFFLGGLLFFRFFSRVRADRAGQILARPIYSAISFLCFMGFLLYILHRCYLIWRENLFNVPLILLRPSGAFLSSFLIISLLFCFRLRFADVEGKGRRWHSHQGRNFPSFWAT